MSRRTTTLILALAATTCLICLIAACSGGQDEPASTLSKAQRDSVLAESNLPGAATVKGALDVADTAEARADRTESAADR